VSETDGATQPEIRFSYGELVEELDIAADQRDALNEACLRLERENADLRQQLANANAELSNGHKALTAAGVPEADEHDAVYSTTGRVAKLRQQLADVELRCHIAEKECDERAQTMARLRAENKKLCAVRQDYSISLAYADAELAELRPEMKSTQAVLQQKRQDCLTLEAEVERLRVRNYDLTSYLADFQRQRNTLRKLVQELVTELDDIMDVKGHTARTRPLIAKAWEVCGE